MLKLSVQRISSITQRPEALHVQSESAQPGTAILGSWLVILALLRPGSGTVKQVFARTWHQMWGALLVGFFIFGLAFSFVYSGMANSMAYGCSKVGLAFIVLAPILGWVGVALSGSNTSTNAMFGPVQAVTGRLLHLPPLMLPSFNSVGAEVGKPIAPQTASVGVSTSRFVRSEGDVIRHNMAWTLVVLAYLVLISVAFYFFAPGLMAIDRSAEASRYLRLATTRTRAYRSPNGEGDDSAGGVRLDVWLDVACLFKTRSEAQKACRGGKVDVNGQTAKPNRLLSAGDEIQIGRPFGRKQRVVVRGIAEPSRREGRGAAAV